MTAQVTEALKSVLESTNRDSDQAFRLTAGEGGGIALALDVQREGDNVVSHQGVPVLLVGPDLPETLRGKTLDISQSPQGTQVILAD